MGRILDFFSHPSHSRTMGILAFLVVLLAIPLTVNIAQKQQELRQRAAFESGGGGICTTNIVKKCYNPEAPATDCTLSPDDTSNCSYAFLATTGRWFNCLEQVCPTPLPTSTPEPVQSDCHFLSESPPSGCRDTGQPCTKGLFVTGRLWDCSGAAAPTPSCDSLNGQCLPPNVGFGDGLAKYNGSCDNSSYSCFEKYKSSGNVTNTGNVTTTCTKDAPGGHYEYVCGSNAGCPAGQHKAAYVCPNVGTWSDTTCYPDSYFTGSNPCAGGPGADCGSGGECVASPPLASCQIIPGNCLGAQQCAVKGSCSGGGVGGAPTTTCNASNAISFDYSCGCTDNVVGGSAPGHKATPICANNVKGTQDPTCYSDSIAGFTKCSKAGAPAAPALAKCPETSRTTCQASPNTCAAQGTQTITYSGQGCTPDSQNVSCPNPASNCNPGSQCPTSGTGTCVAKVQTPPANAQTLTFAIGLDGFGTAGDKKAPGKATGITPKRTRSFFYQVFDKEGAGATELDSGQNQLNFDSGKFTASFKLNKSLTPGAYVIKVRPVGYLSRVIRNVLVDTTTATSPIAVETLATGDIDGDNHLTVNDYTKLKDCMFKDATGACQGADLDDSGKVDQFDYNLFLREIASVQDGE